MQPVILMNHSVTSSTLALCFLAGIAVSQARPVDPQVDPRTRTNAVSPDEKLIVHFSIRDTEAVSGGLFWRIEAEGKTVMEDSRLGFALTDAPALAGGFEIVRVEEGSRDRRWKPVYGEQDEIRDHYNEVRVTVRDGQTPPRSLTLSFRAYNEGIAWRASFPKQKAFEKLTIQSEGTQFRLAGDHQAWTTRSAQGRYARQRISQLKPQHAYERPFVMRTAAGRYLSILEAGVVDYARMRLARDPRAPHALVSRLSGPVTLRAPCSTPWRVVMVADSACELLERNYLLLDLSPPNRLAKTSWIRPGKQMRDITITKKGSRAIVDLAAKAGIDYLEIDAGWYGDENTMSSDPKTVTPSRSRGGFTEADLHDVIAYARSKDIGLIVYVNRRHLEQQLDEILPLYEKWGIAGIKFGFVQVGSQEWTRWLHDSIAKAAAYGMIVNVHDEYRPTGVERSLPNFLTAEGVRGNETKPTPRINLDSAFLRGMCGPADFTMCWHAKSLKLSWAHQMASSVVFYSPLQTLYWYDEPKSFRGDEPYLAFFRALPTVWDEKRVLQGEIGEFLTLARRKGEAWFVGTMNAVKRRQVDIPLRFLTPGRTYTATLYSDPTPEVEARIDPNPKGKGNPESKKLAIHTLQVTSKSTLHVDMANNGGHAIRIVPVR